MTRLVSAIVLGLLLIGCTPGWPDGFGRGNGNNNGFCGAGPYDCGPRTPGTGATYMG